VSAITDRRRQAPAIPPRQDGERDQEALEGAADLRQKRLVQFELEGEVIADPRLVHGFTRDLDPAFPVPGQGDVDLPFHRGEPGTTFERVAKRFDPREEPLELLRSEIRAKASLEAAGGDRNLAVDPVAVPEVEEAGVRAPERTNRQVLGLGVADDDVNAGWQCAPT